MLIEFTQDYMDNKAGTRIVVDTFSVSLQLCLIKGIVKVVDEPMKTAVIKRKGRKAVTR